MDNQHYDFDKTSDRAGTHSAKWNSQIAESGIIPLSVADMDIPAPPQVINKLAEFNQKGIYGYTDLSTNWNQTVTNWMKRQYQWDIQPDWVVFCPRVIQAVALYIQNFTQYQDKIVVLSPSYGPISNIVSANGRLLVESKLRYQNGGYSIDFDDLDNKLKEAKCFILLSPHNPTGIVWNNNELTEICNLAKKHNIFIISDDVHADFIFNKSKYVPISKFSNYVQNNSLICTSPAKTFNLAGLEIANIIIANSDIRNKFKHALNTAGIHNPGYFSVPALNVAYNDCDGWLNLLKEYINQNKQHARQFLLNHIPALIIPPSDGTYLLWVDYTNLQIDESQLREWFLGRAGIDASFGSGFGCAGHGFFRLNLALPRPILNVALKKLVNAYLQTKSGTHHDNTNE